MTHPTVLLLCCALHQTAGCYNFAGSVPPNCPPTPPKKHHYYHHKHDYREDHSGPDWEYSKPGYRTRPYDEYIEAYPQEEADSAEYYPSHRQLAEAQNSDKLEGSKAVPQAADAVNAMNAKHKSYKGDGEYNKGSETKYKIGYKEEEEEYKGKSGYSKKGSEYEKVGKHEYESKHDYSKKHEDYEGYKKKGEEYDRDSYKSGGKYYKGAHSKDGDYEDYHSKGGYRKGVDYDHDRKDSYRKGGDYEDYHSKRGYKKGGDDYEESHKGGYRWGSGL
jgi:hypothetical protein